MTHAEAGRLGGLKKKGASGGPGSGRKKGGSNKLRLAAGKMKKAEITERVKSGGKQTKREINQFGKISKPKKSKREINQFGR